MTDLRQHRRNSLVDVMHHTSGQLPRVFLYLVLYLVLSGTARATAEEAGDWLMRMNDAASDRSYRGVFVLRNGEQMESMRIVHDANPSGMRERIFSLNGEPREIIRNQQEVWCYLPDTSKGVHQPTATDTERRFPGLLPTKISDLENSYELLVGDIDRIANRKVRRIDVRPLDKYRFGYMLWIDTETGLILKADIVGSDGSSLEQYQFVEIEYLSAVPDEDLLPNTPDGDLEWHSPSEGLRSVTNSAVIWEPTKIPVGFKQTSYNRESESDGSRIKHHIVYSDGLVSVSVYVEPVIDEDTLEGSYSMGAMSAYGVIVDEMQVTAMGDVPVETLRELASSTTAKGAVN